MRSNESSEDYLETILILGNRSSLVRAVDIAAEMGFKKPSVSVAMKNLRQKNLITVADNGDIRLTEEGHKIADKVYERHQLISSWLMMLGVHEKTALHDACRIEHIISEESFQALKRAVHELREQQESVKENAADQENLSSANRKQCLYDLKELGYQIGAGFMVGAPGQTMEYLADDLVFLKELNPHMVGIGPFIPHHDTKFAEEPAGSVDLTLFLLSVIRIMLPQVLLPATTALGTLDPRGREKGFQAGANVVMPNLSPVKNRKQYELYDNKICTGEEAAECRGCLSRRVESVGYEIVTDRGDSPMMLH